MPVRSPDFARVVEAFDIAGHVASGEAFGSGHINDTYLVRVVDADREQRYVLQRINTEVFRDPDAVMQNLVLVVRHIRENAGAEGRLLDRQPQFAPLPAHSGASFSRDADGSAWRLLPFIDGTHSVDTVRSPQQAQHAGAAFGRFQRLLAGFDPRQLVETIPAFHDTPARYRRFEQAVGDDVSGRAAHCGAEIDAARALGDYCKRLERLRETGALPERIAHNDAKINNVLFDDASGEPVCIVDLDTVMRGTPLYDFGDLVRTGVATVAEDTRDVDAIDLDLDRYEALVRGYLSQAGEHLTETEIAHLPDSGLVITIETGLRFLTDHLEGDRYFRIARPGHNLDRCRVQFAIARSIAQHMDAMRKLTDAAT